MITDWAKGTRSIASTEFGYGPIAGKDKLYRLTLIFDASGKLASWDRRQ